MPPHLLKLRDLPSGDLLRILRLAQQMKSAPDRFRSAADRKGLLLLFEKTSTRTALSYNAAIHRLGGYAVVLDWANSNFAITSIDHETAYVSRNCDVIMARMRSHESVRRMAAHSRVPVINGCDDRYHPSQAMADFLTMMERSAGFPHVTLCYVGVRNNVSNCLVEGALELGVRLLLVTPLSNEGAVDEELDDLAARSGLVEWRDDPRAAVSEADYVYTDTWVDMENFTSSDYADEKQRRLDVMMKYQLNAELLSGLDVGVMHDMPVHPGYEITDEVIEDPRSIIFDQAENRMHVQQALLVYLLNEGDPAVFGSPERTEGEAAADRQA